MSDRMLYPVTIITTRYGGSYERGSWAAFLADPEQVPEDATGGDTECLVFWSAVQEGEGEWVGRVAVGPTPAEALAALEAIADERWWM